MCVCAVHCAGASEHRDVVKSVNVTQQAAYADVQYILSLGICYALHGKLNGTRERHASSYTVLLCATFGDARVGENACSFSTIENLELTVERDCIYWNLIVH